MEDRAAFMNQHSGGSNVHPWLAEMIDIGPRASLPIWPGCQY
jgi:hypothetical protein